MRDDGPIVVAKEMKSSGWTTKVKKVRYVCFLPHQLLDYVRDTFPRFAIPRDAFFDGTFWFDAREHKMTVNYFSFQEGLVRTLTLHRRDMYDVFRQWAGDSLPTDFEMNGILFHKHWAHILLEVLSDRFPDVPIGRPPLIDIRYEGGTLHKFDQTKKDFAKDGVLTEVIT